jgi:hypothetical protein
VLVSTGGFEPARVISLVDEQATRQSILAAIDRVIKQSHSGDTVLIFYSGHGTSRQDKTCCTMTSRHGCDSPV